MKRRVVITGMGLISALGNDLKTNWENLTKGVSGAGKITQFDAEGFTCQIAAEIKGFDPEEVVPKKDLRRYDRYSLIALKAAEEAWRESGLDQNVYEPSKFGCILGVGIGGLKTFEDNHASLLKSGPRRVSPFLIPAMISNLAPGHIAIRYGLKGVNYTVTSACTSGTHAIGEAFRSISNGYQDAIVTGGTEAAITPIGVGGFARMTALTTRNDDPQKASRPFDKDRDGFLIGEGAGIIVLEEYETAKKRGANIIAEVVGYGHSCDAGHITSPDGVGAISCMKEAVETAQINTEEVGYINAHGTSTPINDPLETKAIKELFGAHAKEGLQVSSTKSMTGHLLGGAGGLEGVVCAKALQTGVLPPTINLDEPDEGCDLDYIPNVARDSQVEYAMSNSFGFGGTNASVLLKRFN